MEFWEAGPASFAALMDRHVESIKVRFRATATLAALYANAHLPEGSKVTPEDFVPGERETRGPPPELEAIQARRFADRCERDNGQLNQANG
jgi:hypothetical protein